MVGRWTRRLWPLVIVGGLLAAVAIMSLLGKPSADLIPPRGRVPNRVYPGVSRPPTSARATSAAASGQVTTHLPTWVADLALYGCAVVAAVVVVWLVWFVVKMVLEGQVAHRSATFGDAAKLTRRAAVLAAVDDSIAELAREDGDARAAVIACWVRLEEVAAAAGTERALGETPSDLVARLLGDHQVSASVLQSLADLYRSARYSTQVIESSMRAQARAALTRLRDELRVSRSGPLTDEPIDDGASVPRPTADAAPGGAATTRRPRPSAWPGAKP